MTKDKLIIHGQELSELKQYTRPQAVIEYYTGTRYTDIATEYLVTYFYVHNKYRYFMCNNKFFSLTTRREYHPKHSKLITLRPTTNVPAQLTAMRYELENDKDYEDLVLKAPVAYIVTEFESLEEMNKERRFREACGAE